MTNLEMASLGVNVILAGVAILAELRARRFIPKLKIILESTSGASNVTRVGSEGCYFIINIINKNARAPAVDVKLLIVGMRRSNDGRSWWECPVNGPVRVSWRRPHDMPSIVNVGGDVQCTVLALVQGESFATIPLLGEVPNNFNRLLSPNEHVQLTLRAVADNCRSNIFTIQMFWDGQWPEDCLEGHIKISKV
jgi:hypothetical protein